VVLPDPGFGAKLVAKSRGSRAPIPNLDSPHQHELCFQMRSFINREAEQSNGEEVSHGIVSLVKG